MSDIIFIYPKDETTDFLNPIADFLFSKHGSDRFRYYRLGFSNSEHQYCRDAIAESKENSIVFFMGHGRSDGLLGAWSNDFERQMLINTEGIEILQNKILFCLACRSADFLRNKNIKGIGFGNLMTSMSEINQARSIPHNGLAYFDVSDIDIEDFNMSLVNVVKFCMHDFITLNLTIGELHSRLRLRFNKIIANILMHSDGHTYRGFLNLIYEVKSQMECFMPAGR